MAYQWLSGTLRSLLRVGMPGGGDRTLRFFNGHGLNLSANPTSERAIELPDKSGTLACLSDLPGGGVATQAQEFDGPTTTTPTLVPQGCTRVRGRLIGGGGGGGSGRRGPAAIIRGGGGGGGGGGTTDFDLNLSSIATSLGTTIANLYWSISVPAGGAGAVGPTADATNGGNGVSATATLLKFQNGPGGTALIYAQAFSGNGGGGGTATAGGTAGAGGGGTYAGGGGTAGGVPSPISSAAQPVGTAGGTGGAGFSAANATGNGANGGTSGNSVSTVGAGGGLAATAAGSTTNAPNHGVAGAPGGGGAGGRSDATVISAAKGSNGYRGGGGGGAAATLNGSAFAPSGGEGGNGYAQLIWSSDAAALTPLYWQAAFTSVIPLSGFTTVPLYAIAANVQFELLTPLTSNRPGAKCVYYLQANGVNVVSFLPSQAALFKELGSSQGWDGRNGVVNRIEFEWDGASCWYSIAQQKSATPTWLPVALTFPTRTAAISQSGNSYSSTTAAAWSAQMTSAQTIPAGKAGRVVVRVDSFCLIGLNDSSAAQAYTNFEYQAWEELNGTITTNTTSSSTANDGVTRGTNLDLYIRLTRNSGGTVTVERSENGTAWTLSRTFANTNTGALFVAADITGPYDSNARQLEIISFEIEP